MPAGGLTRRVVLLRGVHASAHLRAWSRVGAPYEVSLLASRRNVYGLERLDLPRVEVKTIGELLPGRVAGAALRRAAGDRYVRLRNHLRGADIVHSFDLGAWFSAQAAELRRDLGFALVIGAWETIPFLDAYRSRRAARHRRAVLDAADLYLPATERARAALLLEGVDPARMRFCNPVGLEVDRFSPTGEARPAEHVVLSIGRLVWEKGHQDVLRAVALVRRRRRDSVRVLVVGNGPEEARLRTAARELGIADAVEFRGAVDYRDVPGVYAAASCLVVASLPTPLWEEQFAWVLAEAMASHLPIVASASGAIPEVVGDHGALFPPGDWVALARALEEGPLAQPPGTRRAPDPKRLADWSVEAAGRRLHEAYDHVLGG